MRSFKTHEENPSNTPKNVELVVLGKFELKNGETMPELLSKFIELLGSEKEKWGGVQAMKKCMEEFSKGKGKKVKAPTVKDLESFLFDTDLHVPIDTQDPDRPNSSTTSIPSAAHTPAYSKTLKVPDTSHAGKAPGAPGPHANPKALKGLVGSSSSKAVILGVVGPPKYPKTLKVKIYMGKGWNNEHFPAPNLIVKLKVGGENQKTKPFKGNPPCWGEEFVFHLSSPKDVLIVEVYNKINFRPDNIAGVAQLSESQLKQGIHTIPLLIQGGSKPSSALLLARFMFA